MDGDALDSSLNGAHQLADLFDLSDLSEVEFRVRVMEALGRLLMCTHILRGRLNFLRFRGLITLDEQQLKGWVNLDSRGERNEELVWEIVPPRAALSILAAWRCTGKMPDDMLLAKKKLAAKDVLGRFKKDKM